MKYAVCVALGGFKRPGVLDLSERKVVPITDREVNIVNGTRDCYIVTLDDSILKPSKPKVSITEPVKPSITEKTGDKDGSGGRKRKESDKTIV